jgi:hypothetical protein
MDRRQVRYNALVKLDASESISSLVTIGVVGVVVDVDDDVAVVVVVDEKLAAEASVDEPIKGGCCCEP